MLSDLASERGVLSGLFAYGVDGYADVADLLEAETFFDGSNQVIFRCLEYALKHSDMRRVDYPTLMASAAALGLEGHFRDKDEQAHLRAVLNMAQAVNKDTVRRLAGKVRKLAVARELRAKLEAVQDDLLAVTGDESIDKILAIAEKPVTDLTTSLAGVSSGAVQMGEGIIEYIRECIDNPREMSGIPTGFPRYDRLIGGGLQEGCLDLWAGRQKSGKSGCLDCIGVYIAGRVGVPVLNVDTEMNRKQHQRRILSFLTGVESNRIKTGKVSAAEDRKLVEAGRYVQSIPYSYESVIGVPYEEIVSRMRRWVMRKVGLRADGTANPCVILYDYLKLMSPAQITRNIAEHQALGFIAQELKDFAGRYGASILCFAQLNRDGIDYEDSRAIRGSDRILDVVTSFSIYKWKTDEERAELPVDLRKYTHKLIPVLSRDGPGLRDGDYINIETDYARSVIREGPLRSELESGQLPKKREGVLSDESPDEPVP